MLSSKTSQNFSTSTFVGFDLLSGGNHPEERKKINKFRLIAIIYNKPVSDQIEFNDQVNV